MHITAWEEKRCPRHPNLPCYLLRTSEWKHLAASTPQLSFMWPPGHEFHWMPGPGRFGFVEFSDLALWNPKSLTPFAASKWNIQVTRIFFFLIDFSMCVCMCTKHIVTVSWWGEWWRSFISDGEAPWVMEKLHGWWGSPQWTLWSTILNSPSFMKQMFHVFWDGMFQRGICQSHHAPCPVLPSEQDVRRDLF